ncbi:hypothetical protein SFRURICE_003280 [Spodoptera frugiperda]|nr:hypothetical protein SFRURICE_003280 [Spodoptera frugiperda]
MMIRKSGPDHHHRVIVSALATTNRECCEVEHRVCDMRGLHAVPLTARSARVQRTCSQRHAPPATSATHLVFPK